MEGLLDNILTDEDFKKTAGVSGDRSAESEDPIETAFSYPKMEAELGLSKK